jgi:MacB-like protein
MSWKKFFRRRRWDEERAHELDAHLEMETAENIARGMSGEDAAAAAHRKLGNTTLLREEIYRMNSLGLIETLWQDLHYGARTLRKSPGFTIVAVLTLALGIGVNTAIFSMVDWLVFQQLPVQDPKALTYLGFIRGGPLHNDVQFSFPEYRQITEECGKEFDGMAAVSFGGASGGQSGPDGLTFQGKTRPVQTYFVTANFFSLLGLQPALGRFFAAREGNAAGGDPVVILSWEYWHSRCPRGSDGGAQERVAGRLKAAALGRVACLNGYRRAVRLKAFVFERLLRGRPQRRLVSIFRKIAIPADDLFANGNSHQPLRLAGVPGYFSTICSHRRPLSNYLFRLLDQHFGLPSMTPWSSNSGPQSAWLPSPSVRPRRSGRALLPPGPSRSA